MHPALQQSNSLRRAALFLAVLCFWMATGGVVHHTDAPTVARGPLHTVWSCPAAATAAPDECAACEWLQALQTGLLAVCRVDTPLLQARPQSIVAATRLFNRTPPLRGLRAPPCLS